MNDEQTNKDVNELLEDARTEQLEDSKNETYIDGEIDTDSPGEDVLEPSEQTEFNVVAGDIKEAAAADVAANVQEQAKQDPEEVGTGAHAAARSGWANGWGVM